MAGSLGAEGPRTEQQRRSDLFADLLLGRLAFDSDGDTEESDSADSEPREAVHTEWLEVENIDPDTGDLLGTRLQPPTLGENLSGNRTTSRSLQHSSLTAATRSCSPDTSPTTKDDCSTQPS